MNRYRVDTARVYGKKQGVIVLDPNGGFVKWDIAKDLLEALKAIIARIDGEWDNPLLKKWGALSAITTQDILRIAQESIAKVEGR